MSNILRQYMLALFLVVLTIFYQTNAQYSTYFEATDTSFCASVFQTGYEPYIATHECLVEIHNKNDVAGIQYIVGLVSDSIKEPLARFLCAYNYPPEQNVLPCQSFCDQIYTGMSTNDADAAVLTAFGLNTLFSNCSVYTSTSCAGSASNFNEIFLPSPLTFPQSTCEVYEGTICQGLYEYVFVPPHYTQAYLEDQIRQASYFFPLAPTANECVTDFSRYVCARAYWPCHKETVALGSNEFTILLPQMADQSICTLYNSKCSSFITTMSAALQESDSGLKGDCTATTPINEKRNCSQEVITAGISNFPTDSYAVALNSDITFQVPTHNFTRSSLSNPVSTEYTGLPIITCPSPLVLPDDPNTPNRVQSGSCATPCPSLLFTAKEYRTADYLVTIMAAIGTICSTFMLLTWLCFEEKRKSVYVISFLSMGFLLSLAFIISSIAYFSGNLGDSIAHHYCYSNSQEITVEHGGWCVAQAFLIQFSVLSLAAWWSISALDLWVKIVGNQRYAPGSREDLIQKWLYHFWGWAIPLVLTIIALSTNSLGAGDLSTAFCFSHQRVNKSVTWATAYYPLGIYLFLGGGSMVWTIIVLVRSTRAVGSRSWKPYFGAILFVSIFIAIFVIILVYRIIAYAKQNVWKESVVNFVLCLLINSPLQGVDCGERPEVRPSIFLWYFTQFILSGFGFHSFMVYTFSKDNYLLWAARFGRWFNWQRCREWGKNTSEGIKYASHRTGQSTGSSDGASTKTNGSSDGRSSATTNTGSHKPGAVARFNTFRFQNKNNSGTTGWNNSNVMGSQGSSGSAALNNYSFQGEVPSAARSMEVAQDYEKRATEPFTTDGSAIEMTSFHRDVEGIQNGTIATVDQEQNDDDIRDSMSTNAL